MSAEFFPEKPILVVDDEEISLLLTVNMLEISGLNNVIVCDNSRSALEVLSRQEIGLILLDLFMPHIGGEELLSMVSRDFPEIPIIIVTATQDVDTAVRCIKIGAFDFLTKPVEADRLFTVVKNALAFQELRQQNLALKNCLLSPTLKNPEAFSEIITNNNKMLSLFQYAESIAPTSEPVLITGETGAGKELVARAIHELSGRKGAFVAVNVAGLDDNVFSDTLFGHARGAFTGAERNRSGLVEKAAQGTLFLDEIGDLSPISQAKLLRLLQEGDYFPLGQDAPKTSDARVLSATNRDLYSLAENDRFRKDLNYRLRTHHIHILPLRERTDDITLLVDYFLHDAAETLNKKKPNIPKGIIAILESYSFPGNIRELRAMIFDAMSTHNTGELSLQVFKKHIARGQKEAHGVNAQSSDKKIVNSTAYIDFTAKLPTLKQASELLLKEALRRANGNQSLAGRMLGISQQAVSKRVKDLSINK